MRNKKRFLSQGLLHLANLALLVIVMFPLLWMVSSSLKTPKELFSSGINLIPKQFTWENYQFVIENYDFFRWLLNSVATTLGIFVLQVFIALMGSFALSYYQSR